jgi:hypothetical protein
MAQFGGKIAVAPWPLGKETEGREPDRLGGEEGMVLEHQGASISPSRPWREWRRMPAIALPPDRIAP